MAMLAVIDTNILVSSLWSKDGTPARIIGMVLRGELIPCYDCRVMDEYQRVLRRAKFGFTAGEVNALLDWFEAYGRSVVPASIDTDFIDEADRKFYEVAKHCHAVLITGNLRHFPEDPDVMNANDFLRLHPQGI